MLKTYLFSLTLALLLFTAFNSAANQPQLTKAPAWQLETQNGDEISSYQYQNKPIILHFWATWCPYCKKLQPKLVELQEKYAEQGVEIVAISFNEDPGTKPQDSITERGYTFKTAINGEFTATDYGVIGTPTTFFIDRRGNIVFKTTSSDINDPRLELAILEIIKQ